ncbi:hypothetical protein [Methylobacterium sp.]|uniref:hypothetical protein n=1 Tax=Methylobacterium sp. TaxID=409 RepID=UPI000FAFAE6B|nr:hypothetical protein [Methylobacterium sp.]RUP21454.1 MAG: hypothetical protein EKK44_09415 [Methylobacterium sp.]
MPRWGRRSKTDYSYLYGKALDVILDGAIRNRGYGGDRRTFPAEANLALLDLFGERDRLALGDLMDAHAVVVARTGRGEGWSEAFRADVVGNLIGWGVHLGILTEAPSADGERGWRLVERSPVYEIIGGRCVRVRGLPDAEQVAMNRKMASLARRRNTLARKRADETRRRVADLLDQIALVDSTATVPDAWLARIGEPARGMRVTEARGYILAAHDEWPRGDQQLWVTEVKCALAAALRNAAERCAAEAADARLAEDADAFEGL